MPAFVLKKLLPGFALLAGLLGQSPAARGATLNWKGYTWSLTDGGMAGVADGSSANISVDASGYLHLRIVKNGNTWTASEMFTTQKLGFGTYQWQIEGPVDSFDKNNVLGLFPYGPAAGIGGDGTNEIDIEFSRWGHENADNADFTDYPASGNTIGETTFKFSLDGTVASTARFSWTSDSIESSVLKGYQALGSDAGLIEKWKYAPNNPSTNIPQQALPLGINLWCFGAPPSDGQNVEIVIRDFQFVKQGDPLPGDGSGGAGGGGAGGTAGGAAGGGSAEGGAGAESGGTSSAAGNDNGGASGSQSGGTSAGGTSAGGDMPGVAGGATGGGETGATSGGVEASASSGFAGTEAGGTGGDLSGAVPPGSGTASGCACHVSGAPTRGSGGVGIGLAGMSLLLAARRRSGERQRRGTHRRKS